MIFETVIATVLSLQPTLPTKVAEKQARAVLYATDDENEAAALLVTAYRETHFGVGCIQGIGGRGTYGLGRGYYIWACGPLKVQAQMALQALYDKGWNYSEVQAFRGYLGAHSSRWPEVGIRVRLWYLVRDELLCSCSI